MAKKNRLGSFVAGLALALVLGGGLTFAVTQDWQTGHNRLIDTIRAQNGSAELQYQMGERALLASGSGEASGKAVMWLTKAADRGYVPAMLALGDIYHRSNLEADGAQAIKWYAKAAAAGNIIAKRQLAACYDAGCGGLKPDPDKAMSLYAEAALAGDAKAELAYGRALLEAGKMHEAETWLIKAGAGGENDGYAVLGNYYYMAPPGMSDGKKAFLYYGKAAEGGDLQSRLNYSYMYLTGRATKKDPAEAWKWLIIAKSLDASKVEDPMDYLRQRVTPADIAEGQHRAEIWRKAHPKAP